MKAEEVAFHFFRLPTQERWKVAKFIFNQVEHWDLARASGARGASDSAVDAIAGETFDQHRELFLRLAAEEATVRDQNLRKWIKLGMEGLNS